MIICVPYSGGGGGGVPPVAAIFELTGKTVGSTAGMSMLVNSSNDDANYGVAIPFAIGFLGAQYTAVYIGSNSYATFGAGSSIYSTIRPTRPPFPGIHVNAGDRSYQRIYSISESSALGPSFRVRFEGSSKTVGTPGSSNMIWELVFYQNSPKIIDVVCGTMAGVSAATGVTNGVDSQYLYTPSDTRLSYRITSG